MAPKSAARARCHSSSQRGIALIITLILLAVTLVMALAFLAISNRERASVTTSADATQARLAADSALARAESEIIANVLATTNANNFNLLVSTNYINSYGFVPGDASPTNVNYDYYDNGKRPLSVGDFEQNVANLYYAPRPPVFVPTNPVDGYGIATDTYDFRFWLDLNRNGYFEDSGIVPNVINGVTNGTVSETGDPQWIGVLERPDVPHGPDNKFVSRYAFIALPAGNTLDLNYIYNQSMNIRGGDNMTGDIQNGRDGFMRNQGVGSWEINLAAFLADLNTNEWLPTYPPNNGYYAYNEPFGSFNSGIAFQDALSLLAYRYDYNYATLASVGNLYGMGATAFANDGIDGYSDGPLQIGFPLPFDNDNASLDWSGAENTNQYFDIVSDLFDTNETAVDVSALNNFTTRLERAGADTSSTYDRYTFYRLLSELGTDSSPEQNKINLNYSNAVAYYDVDNVITNTTIVPNAETNFVPWTPVQFFTVAADRMLRDYTTNWFVEDNPSNYLVTYFGVPTNAANYYYNYEDSSGNQVTIHNDPNGYGLTNFPYFGITNSIPAISVTNIPVWVNGQYVYSPAVNRILQLAANIYDATTNRYYAGEALPTVFKPVFTKVPDGSSYDVYVRGFTEVTNLNFLSDPILTLTTNSVNSLLPDDLVFGVPLIMGAKKGLPNFNEFALDTDFQLTRKVQVTRSSPSAQSSTYKYNQMFILSITNQLGVECWNSYTNYYDRPVDIYVTNYLSLTLTNDEHFGYTTNFIVSAVEQISTITNGWPGYNPVANPLLSPASFQIPLDANIIGISNSIYRFNGGVPYLTSDLNLPFESNVVYNGSSYPQPHWWLMTTNNLQVFMVDEASGRLIDYVQLRGPNSVRDLTTEILRNEDTVNGRGFNDLWDTNLDNQGIPIGLDNQIAVSKGLYGLGGVGNNSWGKTDQTLVENEIDGFRAFYGFGPLYNNAGAQQAIAKAESTNATQVPYSPTATAVQHISWQANDPLVHYLASDLNWAGASQLNGNSAALTTENLGQLNQRYMPWGGNPVLPGADTNAYNLALKDPLVRRSDDWDFPTNKFPSVGWLGRVHRGTPWQTVYLKAPNIIAQTNSIGADIGTNTWMNWTGNGNAYDAVNERPTEDWSLFDLFTTTFNDDATRGQLSVNVGPTNQDLAAWSALFSGVMVLSNAAPDLVAQQVVQHSGSITDLTYFPIEPAGLATGTNSALGDLVAGINQTRSHFVNPDGVVGSFEHVGDILAVPQLTTESPFLNWNDAEQQQNGISDEMYEWLPQQTMSLLRASSTPRYVIYSYGQTLKPAPDGIVTSGPFFGMVTNYQIVAETATRAVVQFEPELVTNSVTQMITTNYSAVIKSFNVLPSN